MKSFLAAIAFITRIPISIDFSTDDIGKSARWFPLVGALLGGVSLALSGLLLPVFPAIIVAVLILIADTLLTGALHIDGLADTADGFGGGRTVEDMLRIMRDHALGSYGATTLILLFALKIAAISTLISHHTYSPFLVLAPALGRWGIVLLSHWQPYARASEAVSRHIGRREVIWASVLTACIVAGTLNWRGAVCWALTLITVIAWGRYCQRNIGGVTGDCLGACEQIGECVVLLAGVALR
jgi:cobalamin 5'-phosphate synthase/cobalamin synthase